MHLIKVAPAKLRKAQWVIKDRRVPKGPTGDPGPAGAASGIRILRSNCDETACRVQCGESETPLTAYCGAKRNAAIIPTERAATCRSAGPANNPLVAVCAQIAP
jgi:hypothetical protein